MNVARMNHSHGTHDDHEEVYANNRRAAEDLGQNVAVLVDLQGPKIRLGTFEDGPHQLEVGDTLVITTEDEGVAHLELVGAVLERASSRRARPSSSPTRRCWGTGNASSTTS